MARNKQDKTRNETDKKQDKSGKTRQGTAKTRQGKARQDKAATDNTTLDTKTSKNLVLWTLFRYPTSSLDRKPKKCPKN